MLPQSLMIPSAVEPCASSRRRVERVVCAPSDMDPYASLMIKKLNDSKSTGSIQSRRSNISTHTSSTDSTNITSSSTLSQSSHHSTKSSKSWTHSLRQEIEAMEDILNASDSSNLVGSAGSCSHRSREARETKGGHGGAANCSRPSAAKPRRTTARRRSIQTTGRTNSNSEDDDDELPVPHQVKPLSMRHMLQSERQRRRNSMEDASISRSNSQRSMTSIGNSNHTTDSAEPNMGSCLDIFLSTRSLGNDSSEDEDEDDFSLVNHCYR